MNEVVIVVKGGVVQDVFCTDSATLVRVIDQDDQECGDNFIHTFGWPETQWDEDRIAELSQRSDDERK